MEWELNLFIDKLILKVNALNIIILSDGLYPRLFLSFSTF
jgi:hypothetical protein